MFRLNRTISWLALVGLSFIVFLNSCEQKKEPPSKPQEFAEFISAYTSGLISKEAQIRLVLVKPIEDFPGVNEPVREGLVDISPNVEGEWIWEDQNTLLFTPDQHLPSGEQYQVHLQLNALYSDVADDLSRFTFNVGVITQQFEVSNMNLRTYNSSNLNWNKIEGDIISTDVVDVVDLEELLTANQDGSNKRITWRSDMSRMRHHFIIDSVARTAEKGQISFDWAKRVGETFKPEEIEIPALGDFKILGVNVVHKPEQKVIINFSDPLLPDQNVSGLVQIENARQPGFIIEDTELHLLVKGTISGERLVTVFPGIKNVAGYAIKENYETPVKFADLKPAVELIGNGSILPSSSDLTLPFKAVNLKAVDVFVLKIFASNVPQFLQTNRLEGSYQLKRVGRPVAYKKIDLGESKADLKSWNTYALDLADLIKPEPGAIYRVEFKFKGSYSLYACPDSDKKEDLHTMEDDGLNTEAYDSPDQYYWDNYYDEYYWGDYNYRERENPCNSAYYTSRRSVARNIMATDLALTVKGSDNGSFVAFVTDLKTAKPVAGAKVKLLNYQQQTMKEGTTGSDGSTRFKLENKPFLAVAHHQGQDAYMRVDDGSSLSMSNFDVSGSYVKKGLKGFIYGERGVWRPGDSIFTHFILEDAENTLPDGHPVIFEVRNPEGKLVERQVKSSHISGIYAFPFATEADAITGFYSCNVRVGGTTFHKSLRVETIKPNRLKVNLTFDEDILEGSSVTGQLHANWLTGAKAKNLKADINMQIRSDNQPFEAYKSFDFTDETRRFHTSEKEVFKGVLDANGDANTRLQMGSYSHAPGMLKAVFVSRVFEQGGEFSIDRQAFQYAPFEHFVGLKTERPAHAPWLTTDQPITVNLVTTDAQGKLEDRKVSAQVYAIDWSWWWSSGHNGMANYLNSSYARSVSQQELETKNGRGALSFQVNYPNYGNYLIRVCDDESGHCASQVVYIDWPMSRDRGGRSNPGAPTMLTFSADKDEYNVGDVAHLTIPTSKSGRLLLSIETGSELIKHMWVDAEEGQTEIDIPITESMSPNVYAFVSYIQPHAKTENDLPIRLYGVIPINVHDKDTKLEPVITTAVEWQPEKKSSVRVKEKTGKAMAYTIAVVDEGLLDITRFQTPDPWNHFYAKEALGIKTWDFFDDVIGAFGGVIQKNFAIGGDEELDPAGKKRLNRFKPLVKVFGPFYLKAGEEQTTEFMMPNYIGSAKVMVVARKAEAYGHASKAVPVRKPLMVLATLPRVLGPGETVRLPVQVFAMKENVKDVSVNVKAGKLFRVEQTAQNLHFEEVGDQMAYFDLTVQNDIGTGTVDITVQSGKEKATYNVAVEVRNPNLAETRTQSVVIKPGETHVFQAQKFGLPRSNRQTLQISSIPDLNIADALGYLLRYPHGCIEQTVSAAFPQLFVDELMQLTDAQKTLSKENILYAIKKLQANQMGNGAFSTWPSSSYVNAWSTIYAGHFILEAEQKGYSIPSAVKSRWLAYEKRAATNWRHSSSHRWYELEQSYRLFVLAKAGEPDIGAMNRLRNGALTKSAGWRLAAAYALIGQKDVARELISKTYPATSYSYYDPTFGNEMRASAMRLETFLLLKDEAQSFEQAIILAKQLNDKNLYTTQSTSYALLSMSQFLAGRSNSVLQASWKAGNEGAEVKQAHQFYASPFKDFHNDVSVRNTGSENVYVSLVQEGTPLPGQEQSTVQGLSVAISFKTLQGDEIDPQHIAQGADFKAVVRISSGADRYKLHDMALSQIFPSGWEIINTRLLDLEDVSGQSAFTYRDYRDDRVLTYFDMDNRNTKIYEVRLNASYLGRYYLPGVKVEAMYYPEVLSTAKGTWVNVVQPE